MGKGLWEGGVGERSYVGAGKGRGWKGRGAGKGLGGGGDRVGRKRGGGIAGERGRGGKGVGVGLNNKSIQFCLLRFLLPSGNNIQLKTNGGRNYPQTTLFR